MSAAPRNGQAAIALGQDASGEACNQFPGDRPDAAEVICGTWQQPAAVVRGGPQGGADALMALATGGAWREALDQRFVCQAPTRTSDPRRPAGAAAAMHPPHRRLAAGRAGRLGRTGGPGWPTASCRRCR